MITDFFIGLFEKLCLWVIGLFPEIGPTIRAHAADFEVVGQVGGMAAQFFGALNHWFPVTEFFALGLVGVTVDMVIGFVLAIRKIKQILPFQ